MPDKRREGKGKGEKRREGEGRGGKKIRTPPPSFSIRPWAL